MGGGDTAERGGRGFLRIGDWVPGGLTDVGEEFEVFDWRVGRRSLGGGGGVAGDILPSGGSGEVIFTADTTCASLTLLALELEICHGERCQPHRIVSGSAKVEKSIGQDGGAQLIGSGMAPPMIEKSSRSLS